MDLSEYQLAEVVEVNAAPEAVYDLIADVTRMGEWSPVCVQGEWEGDAREWFVGTNVTPERTYATRCRVDIAERGREFAFVNCGGTGDLELARWTYSFAPIEGGTAVTESWQVLDGFPDAMEQGAPGADVATYLDGVKQATQTNMRETLARLKAGAEG